MSVIENKISVAKPLIPAGVNAPLDARTVCDSVDDFPNIQLPYLGMVVFCKSDKKYYKITELQEKVIGTLGVADAQIKSYEEFGSGSSSGDADYVTQDEFDTAIGDINSILDEINGEEV